MRDPNPFPGRLNRQFDPNAPLSELEQRRGDLDRLRDGLRRMMHDDFLLQLYGDILFGLDNVVGQERLRTIHAESDAHRKLDLMERELIEATSFRKR